MFKTYNAKFTKPKHTRTRAPFSYQGGKYREIPLIESFQPDSFERFVEPFGGGGCLSLYYSPRHAVHYNDKWAPIVNVYKCLQDEQQTETLIEDLSKLTPSKELHDEMTHKKHPELLHTFYASKCYYTGLRQDNSAPHLIKPRLARGKDGELVWPASIVPKTKDLRTYTPVVKEWTITNKDYGDVLEQYKSDPGAFLYLDPPYIEKTTTEYHNKFTIADLLKIKEFMEDDETKCKVMLNVDYTAWTRETFAGLYKGCYPIRYSMQRHYDTYQKYHLILTNY